MQIVLKCVFSIVSLIKFLKSFDSFSIFEFAVTLPFVRCEPKKVNLLLPALHVFFMYFAAYFAAHFSVCFLLLVLQQLFSLFCAFCMFLFVFVR